MQYKILSFAFLFSLLSFSSLLAKSAKIAVISDLHYTSPQIMVKDGKALQAYLRHDRKLIKESDAILKETVRASLFMKVPQPEIISGLLKKKSF